jgi:hypothetical protein
MVSLAADDANTKGVLVKVWVTVEAAPAVLVATEAPLMMTISMLFVTAWAVVRVVR